MSRARSCARRFAERMAISRRVVATVLSRSQAGINVIAATPTCCCKNPHGRRTVGWTNGSPDPTKRVRSARRGRSGRTRPGGHRAGQPFCPFCPLDSRFVQGVRSQASVFPTHFLGWTEWTVFFRPFATFNSLDQPLLHCTKADFSSRRFVKKFLSILSIPKKCVGKTETCNESTLDSFLKIFVQGGQTGRTDCPFAVSWRPPSVQPHTLAQKNRDNSTLLSIWLLDKTGLASRTHRAKLRVSLYSHRKAGTKYPHCPNGYWTAFLARPTRIMRS